MKTECTIPAINMSSEMELDLEAFNKAIDSGDEGLDELDKEIILGLVPRRCPGGATLTVEDSPWWNLFGSSSIFCTIPNILLPYCYACNFSKLNGPKMPLTIDDIVEILNYNP